jgi:hypothetical protein
MQAQSTRHTVPTQEEEIEFQLALVAFDLAMSRQLEKLERRWAAARRMARKHAMTACLKTSRAGGLQT